MELPDPPADREFLYRIFEFAPDAILLVKGTGQIIKANAQAETMFGHTRTELLGAPIELLIPERFGPRHIDSRTTFMSAPRTRPMGAGLELFGRRKDGSEIPVDIMLSPLHTEGGRVILAVIRDATERKHIEAEAKRARQMNVKELHHRVKNNLQVISSLLHLQSKHVTDARVVEILNESQLRVRSIALIHEKLYRAPELPAIDFAEYVRDLAGDVFRTYGVDLGAVTLETSIHGVQLGIDTAMPCGLIVNELVSNALKHAFPDGRAGRVIITLKPQGSKEFVLTIADNGIGFPAGFDIAQSTSLGLTLVHDLARQLEGHVQIDRADGTRFVIIFREVHYKDRS